MRDERLSALELLSVESDLLDNISFMDIIDTFASAKVPVKPAAVLFKY
jgi:hypothetical protein